MREEEVKGERDIGEEVMKKGWREEEEEEEERERERRRGEVEGEGVAEWR